MSDSSRLSVCRHWTIHVLQLTQRASPTARRTAEHRKRWPGQAPVGVNADNSSDARRRACCFAPAVPASEPETWAASRGLREGQIRPGKFEGDKRQPEAGAVENRPNDPGERERPALLFGKFRLRQARPIPDMPPHQVVEDAKENQRSAVEKHREKDGCGRSSPSRGFRLAPGGMQRPSVRAGPAKPGCGRFRATWLNINRWFVQMMPTTAKVMANAV